MEVAEPTQDGCVDDQEAIAGVLEAVALCCLGWRSCIVLFGMEECG